MKQALSDILTVEEVAEQLRVDPRTVYRMIQEKALHAVRAGRLWRVPKASLEEYLKGNGC
jgi:excisionase family DNA binding protein